MEILAGLIKLNDRSKIPLPWYNRPALSLRTGTKVWVTQVRSTAKTADNVCPPDMLITPLTPSVIENTRSITIDVDEKRGAIGELISLVSEKCNVDLMETVTIDQRTKHRVTFVLQPKNSIQDLEDFSASSFFDELNNTISEHLSKKLPSQIDAAPNPAIQPIAQRGVTMEYGAEMNVQQLYVDVSDVWDPISEKSATEFADFDFNRVVISSNTESRFIRCIIPRKGAFELRITHKDRPKATRHISECLGEMGFNVLLSRVSKVSSVESERAYEAETVLICEPQENAISPQPTDFESIRETIVEIRARLAPHRQKFSFGIDEKALTFGRSCKSVLRPLEKNPYRKPVEVPYAARKHLDDIIKNESFPGGKKRLFLSMRGEYKDPGNLKEIYEVIRAAARARNIEVVDGFKINEDRPLKVDYSLIWARIWTCDAAFFIAARNKETEAEEALRRQRNETRDLWLTPNQMMEWSFFYAMSDNSDLIRHRRAANPDAFMMPNNSSIVFGDLNTEGINRLRSDVEERLDRWFG